MHAETSSRQPSARPAPTFECAFSLVARRSAGPRAARR